MPTHSKMYPRRVPVLLLLPLLAAACVDSTPLMPGVQGPPSVAVPALQCFVDVRAETMTCTTPDGSGTQSSIAANRIFGGQEKNIRLYSNGASYDAGTEIFTVNVSVQNLLQAPLGTSDGSTVDGVRIFFGEGPTAVPSGTVTVANPTGTAFFTEPNQPYFLYNQILDPYELSVSQPWQFNMAPSVASFTFTVYVSAPQADEMLPMLGSVWEGTSSTLWSSALNWRDGVVPDSAAAAAVPPDSMVVGSFMPVLDANAQLTHLRVGGGSTFDLAGYTLTAWGNVDAPGVISNGTLRLGGAEALIRGSLPSMQINGAARLQGATVATGAVSVSDGSLTVSGSPLSISLP